MSILSMTKPSYLWWNYSLWLHNIQQTY